MKQQSHLFFLIILLFGIYSPLSAVTQKNYQLGVGDKIEIQVYGETDLSLQTRINDDGIITYPFIGEIQILGMTLGQLQLHITRLLKGDYLVNPNVNVSVIEYRKFFIRGEVKQPGSYPFQPGLTVDKAVSIAGGFTERASRGKIFVIHGKGNINKPLKIYKSNKVKPGDIIIVEQSFF